MSLSRVKAPADAGPAKASFAQCVEWHGVKPSDVERLLRAAVRLLRDKGWTQKEGARRADGSRCKPADEDAALFSINGALMRAESDLGLTWAHALAAGAVIREAIEIDPLAFNEERGRMKHEIEDAFTRALWRVRNAYGEAA